MSSRHPHDDSSLLFRLMSDRCKCFDSFGTVIPGCKYCKAVSESAVISKFCKILRGRDVQDTVLELSLRTFVEMVLLQARVFSKLAQTQRSDYLRKNSYTAIDAEIFNFFKYFSWHYIDRYKYNCNCIMYLNWLVCWKYISTIYWNTERWMVDINHSHYRSN